MNPMRFSNAIMRGMIIFAFFVALAMIAPVPASAKPNATITITVDTTTDSNDAAYQQCTTAANDCSLRGAISKANADTANVYVITLPAGTYTLTIAGAGENANATGDLDVKAGSNITLNGAGASTTIIDGNQLDRVWHVIGGATATLNNVTLRNGKTQSSLYGEHCNGGGVYNAGTLTIADSVISGNAPAGYITSDGSGCDGGGIANSGTLAVQRSTIRNNVAGNGNNYYGGYGGGIYATSSTTIDSSTISGNTTGQGTSSFSNGYGGGVHVQSGTTTLTNSTLSGNIAGASDIAQGRGGGLSTDGSGTANLIHVTITGNNAYNGGGLDRPNGTTNMKNSIVAGNTSSIGSNRADCNVSPTSQGYNLVGSGTGCTLGGTGDQTTSNAQLGALQNNGGSTETHALLYNSPAVEVIPYNVNGCGTTYTTDQRNAVRPAGGACDVGAYESNYIVWDGGGADNNTSTVANWSGDYITPATTDIPVFTSKSSKNATVDTNLTVAGWLVDNNYAGTISQGSSNITTSGDWNQSGGTFSGGSGTLDLGGAFNFSAGTFTAPSGLLSVGGVFNRTGGTFNPNGGRVVLASPSNQTLATAMNHLTINDGLVGYWKLDEGTGTTTADASGYGYAGTLYNTPTWNTSVPSSIAFYDSNSLGLNRTSAPYVQIPTTPKIDQAQQLSLATWVRLASTPTGAGFTYMRFISLGNEKAVLRYQDNNGTGKLEFYMKIGGSLYNVLVNQTWATNTWYHVAGTYDGSTMRVYLNGTQVGSFPIAGTVDAGNGVRLSHSANSEALDGLLDDVRIYNRALSTSEISDLAAGKHPQTSLATTTLGGALNVSGDLVLNSGTLDVSASNYALNVAGNFTRNGGVLNARSGTVTFNGSSQTLDSDTLTFNNLTINSGANVLVQRNPTVNGTLTNNGTLRQIQTVVSGGTTLLGFGNYGGVSFSGANLGSTTVSIDGNRNCAGASGGTIRRCFILTPTTSSAARVTFYFSASELAGNSCAALDGYHWNGSGWDLLTLNATYGTGGRSCGAEPYSVRFYPVSSFSPFALKSGGTPGGTPTAVTLSSFRAQPGFNLGAWLRNILGR